MAELKKNKSNAIDLIGIVDSYEGKWIVLSTDNKKILASGNTFSEIKDQTEKGIAMKVPFFDSAMSPSTFQ